MKIRKIFNNNIVAAISEDTGDVILTGIGIGFQKRLGDEVETSKIERTYVFQNQHKQRFEQLVRNVPILYFEITNQIINVASKKLHVEFRDELFIAISDHICFAVHRKEENVYLPNIILNETRVIYQKEYKIGMWALRFIEEKTGTRLDDDEAGYIALHLVNFSINNKTNNAKKIISLTKEVLNVIQITMKIELDKNSLGYARISTHLKYLAEHIFRDGSGELHDTTANIRNLLHDDTRLTLCINRIVKLIRNRYRYELTPDEQTYLCIHIKKNASYNS